MGTTTSGETIFEFFTGIINTEFGQQILITANNYSKQVILTARPVLPIKFLAEKIDGLNWKYTIIIGTTSDNEFKIVADVQTGRIKSILEGDNIPGISVTFNKNNYIIVILSEGSFLNKCTYKTGDEYDLSFTAQGPPSIEITFKRSNRTVKNDGCNFKNTLTALNNLRNDELTIPSIDINFQSLIDGSDIGNTVFVIIDNVDYYNHKTTPIIPNYTCKSFQTNNPKTTIFSKACPLISNVLRGIGNTAYEKIVYLMENVVTDQNDAYDFALLLVKYSMLKYILARLMYGNFNIKYILNKYNKKFLNDLSNTRFCKFVYDFTNPNSNIFGFNKYFL